MTDLFIADISTPNLCIELNNNILFVAIYCQQNELKIEGFQALEQHRSRVVIAGDYNAKDPDWNNPGTNTNGSRLKSSNYRFGNSQESFPEQYASSH